jgi:hypothetical protein
MARSADDDLLNLTQFANSIFDGALSVTDMPVFQNGKVFFCPLSHKLIRFGGDLGVMFGEPWSDGLGHIVNTVRGIPHLPRQFVGVSVLLVGGPVGGHGFLLGFIVTVL